MSVFDGLVCPACNGGLSDDGPGAQCRSCGQRFTALQGVALLLPGLSVRREAVAVSPGFIDDIAAVVSPHLTDQAIAPMRELFSTKIDFPDARLSSEGHRFVHRLRSSGLAVREPSGDGSPPAAAAPVRAHDGLGRAGLTLTTAPPQVLAGSGFHVQVRVANDGPAALPSGGPDAVTLHGAVRQGPLGWLTRRGRPAPPASSGLLVDIPPGEAVTQPVSLTAPGRLGPVQYEVVLRGADGRPVGADAIRFTVTGVSADGPDPLAVDWAGSDRIRDYGEDHNYAVELLVQWLSAHFGTKRALRVLELGGNAAPMLAKPEFDLPDASCFNLDIDPFGLVFGTVQRRLHGGRAIQDVVADGMRLPFANKSLDLVVMFATLHHFPDPVGLLRHLASKLAPGGLICVCCEPVGQVASENIPPGFRDELLAGICEQAFQPWEWQLIFAQAGLRTAFVHLDTGSLKIALTA